MVPRVTDDHDVGDDVNDNKDPMTTVMKMMMMIEQRMRDHAMMPGLGTEIRWTAARREKERKIFDHFAEMVAAILRDAIIMLSCRSTMMLHFAVSAPVFHCGPGCAIVCYASATHRLLRHTLLRCSLPMLLVPC